MFRYNSIIICIIAIFATSLTVANEAESEKQQALTNAASRYPTEALADYVFACMASNGQTYDVLKQCSCSIDYIGERIPFNEYEKTETIMQLQQETGNRGVFYKDTKWAKSQMERLKKVQAESTLECFN